MAFLEPSAWKDVLRAARDDLEDGRKDDNVAVSAVQQLIAERYRGGRKIFDGDREKREIYC